jgi:hypothetical protein
MKRKESNKDTNKVEPANRVEIRLEAILSVLLQTNRMKKNEKGDAAEWLLKIGLDNGAVARILDMNYFSVANIRSSMKRSSKGEGNGS